MFVSLANKGSYNLEAHISTAKHKKQIQSCHDTPKVSEFLIKQIPNTNWRSTAISCCRTVFPKTVLRGSPGICERYPGDP
jgi:hypothetical protein